MSPRYLLVVPDHGREQSAPLDQLASRTGLAIAWASQRMTLLTNAACRFIPAGNASCILGSLFPRHGPARQVGRLADDEQAAVRASGSEALLRRFWGGYVAVLEEAESIRVIRDPSGLFPAYFTRQGSATLFASDAEVLAAAGVVPGIDVAEVGRQLYRAFVPASSTALREVRELLPGFAVPVPGDHLESCWSPWNHVTKSAHSFEEAAGRLARILQHCLQSWASAHGRLLLSVSGGLDSSIIACCLARAGADVICLTMFSDDAAGDERPFARALCEHLGLPLVERPYRLEDVVIAEPLAPHLPNPRDRTQANAYERVHLEVADEVGATAFMTGNGGDNVCGFSQSAAPVADRYLVEGLGAGTLGTLLDVCRQTGCSLFDAAGQAWRLAHRPPAHVVRPNPLLLARDFTQSLGPGELQHPWLFAPAEALPGKAAHISAVLRVQPNLGAHRDAFLPFLTPLLSQPILEACLSIPSWDWRRGGRDRALARRAFADALPATILERRVKGTPSRFAARLLEHFRPAIRDRLLGGRLASHAILDLPAVERLLFSDAPVPDLERVRLLEMVNAEAWLDHWSGRAPVDPRADQLMAAGERPPLSTRPRP